MLCSGLQGRAEEVIGSRPRESWQRSCLPLGCILGHTSEVFQAAFKLVRNMFYGDLEVLLVTHCILYLLFTYASNLKRVM